MTTKRLFLAILTIIIMIPLLFSLGESFRAPQVQSDLALSQADLILQASELKPATLNLEDIGEGKSIILGQNPYQVALEQYQSAIQEGEKQLTQLENKIQAPSPIISANPKSLQPLQSGERDSDQSLSEKIRQSQLALQKKQLKLGLLAAHEGKMTDAIANWQAVAKIKTQDKKYQEVASILEKLWNGTLKPPINLPDLESPLKKSLNGWFRDKSLAKLYDVAQASDRLAALEIEEQESAKQTLLKLGAISLTPIIFGLTGSGIIVFLLVQWLLKKDESLLASFGKIQWETPWDGEIIWQVLVVGFFFVAQIALPVIFGFLHFDSASLDLRGKAFYVLLSYLTMTAGGLAVLYFSIKPYFPLPKGWFHFNLGDRWFLWGLGGYFVAIPLVVMISLVNQSFWQGQGGSNPLLSLALESQDWVVLAIFFGTASIAAPFFEEMIFRGFLIPSLTRYVPIWAAIGISSVIFAVAHLNLSEVLPLLALGVILGMVYSRSQNLLASMLLHSLWNSGTLLSLFILGSGG